MFAPNHACRGLDSTKFLQGLTTNDINDLRDPHDVLYTAFLTPKGRVKFDAFVSVGKDETTFFLDCPRHAASDIKKYLRRYKLRSDVHIDNEDQSVWAVMPLQGCNDSDSAKEPEVFKQAESFCQDPRCQAMGFRAVVPPSEHIDGIVGEEVGNGHYHALRISHGIAEA